jgi:hypothetical protein
MLTVHRHVHRLTERLPHRLGSHALIEGRLRSDSVEGAQNEITHEGTTLHLTELIAHGDEELASGHALRALASEVRVEVAVKLIRKRVGHAGDGAELFEDRETLAHLNENLRERLV